MHGLMSHRRFGRARLLRSDRADERSVVTARAQSLHSDRANARARSLRSDRAKHAFGRCVATLFELLSDDSPFGYHQTSAPKVSRNMQLNSLLSPTRRRCLFASSAAM
ncbi:hypothetical protein DY000_02049469 [Brassica cretica]|uniref:Uncharacterized protein n=1 Tax=Brassica cretica TaxID=69181 RepID=A0ABQ7EMZ4_BRACR|nr:hypothetical protein DY000_02049469 [Brassica cretica]